MVLPSAAPEPSHDDGWRDEVCVSCLSVCTVGPDGDVRDVDGDDLIDAEQTPLGFCCSRLCRSQAVYDHADEYEKEALRAVRDACMVIAEHGRIARRVIEDGMQDALREDLIGAAENFLEMVADDGKSMPTWCNRPSLETVTRRACVQIVDLAKVIPIDYVKACLSIAEGLKEAEE